MSHTRTLLVAAIAAIALVGAGAAFGASTTTASGSGALDTGQNFEALAFEGLLNTDDPAIGTADGSADRKGPGQRFRYRGGEWMLHGEVVVKGKDGAPLTVALQRGTVSAIDRDSVTVKSEDGYERTWTLTTDTRYRSAKAKAGKDGVEVGVIVRLAGPVTDGTATARVVGIPPAAKTS